MLRDRIQKYVNDADNSCCANNYLPDDNLLEPNKYLDHDYWNDTLLVRNFLVEHAPINNIMYPQSTGLCLTRNPNPFVEGPDLWKALGEKQFWEQNNSPQSLCPTQGVPLLNACKDDSATLCPLFEKCSDYTGTVRDLPPWVGGIKKNIDADSAVKGLQYLNNRDCYENSICCTTNHELRENKCQQ